jgi:hypothetical protein
LRNFVLASSKGLVLDSELYQGKTTPLPETHLGLDSPVFLRLVETLPANSSKFFDRYFTTVPLLNSFLDRGSEGTGTILRNRVKYVHLSRDSKMKRGDIEEFCRDCDKLVEVQWKDSKAVALASTSNGFEPVENVRRWSKTEENYVMVPSPCIVRRYNQCMVGVDVRDQLMEAYRTFLKTKKWTSICKCLSRTQRRLHEEPGTKEEHFGFVWILDGHRINYWLLLQKVEDTKHQKTQIMNSEQKYTVLQQLHVMMTRG